MIWKTTNYKGEVVTWYDQEEMKRFAEKFVAKQTEAAMNKHIIEKIAHYAKLLMKANSWWDKTYRKVLILQIMSYVQMAGGNNDSIKNNGD